MLLPGCSQIFSDSYLLKVIFRLASGWHSGAAVCVVMASGGYPGKYEKNKVIYGLEKAKEMEKCFVFHAGTALQNDRIVTSGGRVLNLTAWDLSLESAVKRAYELAGRIEFEGVHYRKDIAYRALQRK